jgi:hypothetical protein
MWKLAVIVVALLAAGCAAHRSEVAAVSGEAHAALAGGGYGLPALPGPEGAEPTTIDIRELDNGLVCESRRNSSTRISRKVCFTREEQAAAWATDRQKAQNYLTEHERQQQMYDQQQYQMDERVRRGIPAMGR